MAANGGSTVSLINVHNTKECHGKGCTNPPTLCLVYLVPPVGAPEPVAIHTKTLVCEQCASDEEARAMLKPTLHLSGEGKSTASSNDIRSAIRRAFITNRIGMPDLDRAKPRFIPFTLEKADAAPAPKIIQ